MAAGSTHFLEGKKIVVAGAGIAGLAFVSALHKQWDPSRKPPKVVLFDRDNRDATVKREGYSLSLNGADKDGGLVALQQLGVLDKIMACSVLGDDGASRFRMWDSNWDVLIGVKLKPYGTLPSANIRIRRKDLRRILVEAAEAAGANIHWGTACTGARRLESGKIQVQLANPDGAGVRQEECDVLIAADGAHSKVRASLRPDDTLQYAGAILIGGTSRFPNGIPQPLDDSWGLQVSGQGICCFYSKVDEDSIVWGIAQLEEEKRSVPKVLSAEEVEAMKKEALERGHMLKEPFKTCVEATETANTFMLPAMDKQPFAHNAALRGVVFLGDANHAVSPFAGNGANLALKDGWDLAAGLCDCDSIDAAVTAYDAISIPRAVKTLKTSHQRIKNGHASGLHYQLLRAGLAVGRTVMWLQEWFGGP